MLQYFSLFSVYPLAIFHLSCSAFGDLPGVRIVETSHVSVSSLLADQFCGAGTKLIYYLNPGELLSRPIVYKDTHSPRGDLLVVYSDQQQETAAVLGFSSPSFGGDIVLPATINAQLRTLVLAGHGSKEDQGDVNDAQYAEQLLANTASDVSVPQVRKLDYILALSGGFSLLDCQQTLLVNRGVCGDAFTTTCLILL